MKKTGRLPRSSVKESMDNLPAGLCFSRKSGLVILCNRRMNELSQIITGAELQDANAFWDWLSKEPFDELTRFRFGQSIAVRLPDGRVWAFSRERFLLGKEAITQMSSFDVTDLDAARQKLNQANQALSEMNSRLRQYGKNIVETTAREERLETKMRINDELGSILLTTRRYLQTGDGDPQQMIELWRLGRVALQTGGPAQTRTSLSYLENAAAALGVTLVLEGEFPAHGPEAELLFAAAAEALNNAVRHGKATLLSIAIRRSPGSITALFSNDGTPPTGRIVEGGGLAALRETLERAGGSMEIRTSPAFTLQVEIPTIEPEPEGEKAI